MRFCPIDFSASFATWLRNKHNSSVTTSIPLWRNPRYVSRLTGDDLTAVGGASDRSLSQLWTTWRERRNPRLKEKVLTHVSYSCLPFIRGIQGPDVHGAFPISGDYDPFPRSNPSHDVVHPCDEGGFWQTNDCVLKVFCFLQRLRTTHRLSFTSSSGQLLLCVASSPPAPASWRETRGAREQTPRSSTSSTSALFLMSPRNKREDGKRRTFL